VSKPDGVPEVFGDGDVTVVVNNTTARVYVGSVRLDHVDKVTVESGADGTALGILFSRSHDADVSRSIEENVRAAKALPWVKVLR